MRTIIIYKIQSEDYRTIEEFTREFERRYNYTIEKIDKDSKEGLHLCQVYDIWQLPAIMVIENDGRIVQMWQGLPLPLINDVRSYSII